ncbi:MAG TPA: NrfD/PsrC family molybdoenzyme membrane anchor subunit, partial [Dehalococcoidia bacterium]|nr:NrfD/PsrC family molybdoenzyme membrane anchor subunit [Dehalococcoidia bacterium]
PFARIAILVSVVTAALAGLYVFPDLGHPERVWRMFTSPNWSSPLLWDMIAMLALFVVGVLYLGAHLLERERATKAMAYVAMATAVAALLVSASLLGLQASRPMWYSAVMAPLFVASGLVAGLALLLMVALALEWLGIYRFRTESVSRMAGLLAVLVAIEVVLVFTEIVTAIYPGEARDRAAPEALLSGRYAPTFWVEIAACGLLPIVLLAVARLRRRASVVAGASALVLAGIFLMRLNLLMAGFLFPYINLPGGIQVRGLVPGPAEFQMSPTYYPGWVEWLVMFGLMSLGALVLSAALAYWPLQRRLAPRLALKGGAEGETGRYVA